MERLALTFFSRLLAADYGGFFMLFSGNELDQIQGAFTQAFTPDTIERLLKLKLDKELSSITQGGTTPSLIFDVVTAAEREGWLQELITAAKLELPRNQFIQALTNIDNSTGGDSMGGSGGGNGQSRDLSIVLKEMELVLYGSQRGNAVGFIDRTEKRLRRLEMHVDDNGTVPREVINNIFMRIAFGLMGLTALASLALGAWNAFG